MKWQQRKTKENYSNDVLRKELTYDGLHLKEEGYKIWVDAIKKKMKC